MTPLDFASAGPDGLEALLSGLVASVWPETSENERLPPPLALSLPDPGKELKSGGGSRMPLPSVLVAAEVNVLKSGGGSLKAAGCIAAGPGVCAAAAPLVDAVDAGGCAAPTAAFCRVEGGALRAAGCGDDEPLSLAASESESEYCPRRSIVACVDKMK